MKRHGGKILIENKMVLEMLGYPGGKLHYFGRSEDYGGSVAIIEHPNMPEVEEGEVVPLVGVPILFWNIKDYHTIRITPSNFLHRIRTCTNAFLYCWRLYGWLKSHKS